MTLLDLQGLETPGGGGGGGCESNLSVLLCGNVNSNLSVTLCV